MNHYEQQVHEAQQHLLHVMAVKRMNAKHDAEEITKAQFALGELTRGGPPGGAA